MIRTKLRSIVIALIATSCLAVPLVAPAASQAQWHTIVVDGHVFTHGNFTEGGVSPCTRITKQLGGWEQAVGDLHEKIDHHGRGPGNAKEELEDAEGELNRASGEAFEYGCDVVTPAVESSPGGPHVSTPSGITRSSVR
jgi:hypothetical protein